MKDHKLVERNIRQYEFEGAPLDDFLREIKSVSEGIINPIITLGWDDEIIIQGWIPLSSEELAAKARRSKTAKEAAARRKEKKKQQELAELKRLKEKYGHDN